MDDFPDVNVWVALSSEDHPAHPKAKKYFEEQAAARLVFCRVTALGLVRVTSQRHTFGGEPLTAKEAWQTYLQWRRREDVKFSHDPAGLDERLGTWVRDGMVSPRSWTDLYLAAFACESDLRLVTFDQGFRRIPHVNVFLLDQVT